MEKKKNNFIKKFFIVCVIMAIVLFILMVAPDYIKESNNKLNIIINYTDVTDSMKQEAYIDESGNLYLSNDDIKNFYDEYIYYDEKYDQIITSSDTKLARLLIGQNEKIVNGEESLMNAEVKEIEGKFFIPFSELQDVYNVKATYIEETNTFVLDSLDRKLETATSLDKNKVKYKPTIFSKTVDELEKGEEVYIVQTKSDDSEYISKGYIKVRTRTGKLGYIKQDSISEKVTSREAKIVNKQIEGKVSLVWEYFSEYGHAPDRKGTTIEGVNVVSPSFFTLEKLGKGNLLENVGTSGEEYIKWAHSNGYKVWPLFSNDSMKETTSEIMKDYKLREKLINQIVDKVKKYNLDGVNIDFEYMKEEDRDLFSRFIIELTPRIKSLGKVVSVDVTAPDGSPDWSLCFDRNVIGNVADYIMFMAYDQHGEYVKTEGEEGTVAGFDWVELNINKFLGTQEEVSSEKLVLGMPFYTRLWKVKNGEVTSSVVTMKNIEKSIPEGVTKEWDEILKQNYIQYEKDGAICKMWIEDESSIKEKLSLVNKYNLAGSSYWVKDFESESIWNIIKQELNKE